MWPLANLRFLIGYASLDSLDQLKVTSSISLGGCESGTRVLVAYSNLHNIIKVWLPCPGFTKDSLTPSKRMCIEFIKASQAVPVLQSPGSSVHGLFQARILEWVAISSSRGSSGSRDQSWDCCLAGGLFTSRPSGKSFVNLLQVFFAVFYQTKWASCIIIFLK